MASGMCAERYGRMDGVRHVSSTTKRLDVVAWLLFIRINAVVVAMSDFPVEKYGPDRPEGMPLRGALDDRLDLGSRDPRIRTDR